MRTSGDRLNDSIIFISARILGRGRETWGDLLSLKLQRWCEYLRKTRNNSKPKYLAGIDTWAVLLVRHSGPLLKRTREEFKQMNKRTRKYMTMHKALYPREDVHRLYVSRKEGRRGLSRIQDSVVASIKRREDCIKKRRGRLIIVSRNNTET